jgi:hypothetical protein
MNCRNGFRMALLERSDVWYAGSYVNPCADCANLTAVTDREPRGGYFDSTSSSMGLPPDRGFGALPAGDSHDLGFRCARTP